MTEPNHEAKASYSAAPWLSRPDTGFLRPINRVLPEPLRRQYSASSPALSLFDRSIPAAPASPVHWQHQTDMESTANTNTRLPVDPGEP